MAGTKNQTEHPSRTIVKTMTASAATGVYPKVILLCGKEDFLIKWSKDYIKSLLLNPLTESIDCSVFSEDAIDAQSIIQTCDTPPMMSKKKLVLVEDSDIFTAQIPRDMNKDDAEMLASYISKVPETSMLVFTSSKPNKTKAIYKAIAKNGIVYDFTPLDDATLGGWAAKRAAFYKKQVSKTDLVNFAKICGYGDDERNYTLFNLENDLKLIFTLYSKDNITLGEMLDAVEGQAEVNAFKLLDNAFSGRKGKALEILNSSIYSQAPSKEMGIVLSFLGLLISQLEIMVEGKERQELGQSQGQIISEMKVNEYRYKKAMGACQGTTALQLKRVLFSAFQIEKDMKQGNINGKLALELFIAKV